MLCSTDDGGGLSLRRCRRRSQSSPVLVLFPGVVLSVWFSADMNECSELRADLSNSSSEALKDVKPNMVATCLGDSEVM